MGVAAPANTIPKNAKGNLVFKTHEDYERVLSEQVAKGQDMELLSQLLNRENVVIEPDAAVQPVKAEPVAPTPKPAEPEPARTNWLEKLRAKAKEEGVSLSYDDEDSVINALILKEKRVRHLETERSRLQNTPDKTPAQDQELQELKRELEEVKARAKPSAPVAASKMSEIRELRRQLKTFADPLSPEAVAVQDKLQDAYDYELERMQGLLTTSTNPTMDSKYIETITNLQSELKAIKEKQTSFDEEVQARKIEQARSDYQRVISTFQKDHNEFATKRDIYELDADYQKFANRLMQESQGRFCTTTDEMRNVVNEYLNSDTVQKSMRERGIEKPVELDKYLEICELMIIRDKLNRASLDDREHTLEDALIYKKQRSGKLSELMASQREVGANALKNAQTQRETNFAQVLDASAGASPEVTGDTMTEEQAAAIIQTVTPLDTKKDPSKRQLLVKALQRLKLPVDGI